jgi:tetratricopeptide (TPR) repeat protein
VLAPGTDDHPVKAQVLLKLAHLSFCQGDNKCAAESLEHSLALCQKHGDMSLLADALAFKSNYVIWAYSDYEQAEKLAMESLALYREMGQQDRWRYAQALNYLGEVYLFKEDYPRAALLFEEGLNLFRKLRENWGICYGLANMATVA